MLQLTSKADNEDPDLIRASIQHRIRDAEVFVPASVVQRGNQRVYQYLMEGYAFVRDVHPAGHYTRLEDTKYVHSPLYMSSTGRKKDRKLAKVSQSQIDQLRSQIKIEVDQGIEVGDTVLIISGPYKNIEAIVREEIPEQDAVVVHIQLRSTDRLVTLPRAFLHLERKSAMVVYKPRVDKVQLWVEGAKVLLGWAPSVDIQMVRDALRVFESKDTWLSHSRDIYSFFQAYYYTPDWDLVEAELEKFDTLSLACAVDSQIQTLEEPLPGLDPVLAKYREWEFLHQRQNRITQIHSRIADMTETKPVNLVVDGTQLFIRCSEAPGLGSLTDSQGRSTGPIVGFLRALGSYHKRFPGVNVYVCWDGSSQRRKLMYPEYKANRSSRSGQPSFGIDWLKENLPFFGVVQAYNPEEEADDVMASLVRGPLKDAPNVMVTTDKDLLQVVSDSTHQLCPAVGAGREKIYDPFLVKSEYGVTPDRMVHIRALSGDKSDNIPGVVGFGVKTASKIVGLYGTVTSLLKSNLAGLSKSQVAKLRANEQQILKNLELLQLRDVSYRQIDAQSDKVTAERHLRDLEIKAEPIIKAFFG